MKQLLLLCGILSGMAASAQTEDQSVPPADNGTVLHVFPLRDSNRLKFTTSKPMQPGVYRLPGGMPCVVPDTRNLSPMPNGWRGPIVVPFSSGANRIPNPASPGNVRVISLKS